MNKNLMKKYGFIGMVLIVFVAFVFLRFFDPETRAVFGYDQVTNSWIMRDMILYKVFPLTGMVAKLNSGLYIGPLYYYLLAPFYWVYHLDPRAGMTFVGIVGIITFIGFYTILSKLLSKYVALIGVILYTFSAGALSFDRIPWPVVFIPVVSLLIYLSLYKIMTRENRYWFVLACALGFSFHIHFSSMYYLIIIGILFPFLVNKKNWKYIIVAFGIFLVWLLPNIIAEFSNKLQTGLKAGMYASNYYHGIHLRRIIQLWGDAFIEYSVLFFDAITHKIPTFSSFTHWISFLTTGVFFILLWLDRQIEIQKRLILTMLSLLWILVPWFAMSVYSGEISNYYFATTRPIVVMMTSYVLWRFMRWNLLSLLLGACCIVLSSYYQIKLFLSYPLSKLPEIREEAKKAVRENKPIPFTEGAPQSYLYEYYLTVEHSKEKIK